MLEEYSIKTANLVSSSPQLLESLYSRLSAILIRRGQIEITVTRRVTIGPYYHARENKPDSWMTNADEFCKSHLVKTAAITIFELIHRRTEKPLIGFTNKNLDILSSVTSTRYLMDNKELPTAETNKILFN